MNRHDAYTPTIDISTDYIFSGNEEGLYTEDDQTGLQSIYGNPKLTSERAVATANPAHAILCPAYAYSPFRNNLAKSMLHMAAGCQAVGVATNQHDTPTYASNIAEGILVAC